LQTAQSQFLNCVGRFANCVDSQITRNNYHIGDLGRVANPRSVARIKTGRVSQPITDAADATGRGRSWNATRANDTAA